MLRLRENMCKEEDEKQCVYHTERMYIFTQEHCWPVGVRGAASLNIAQLYKKKRDD